MVSPADQLLVPPVAEDPPTPFNALLTWSSLPDPIIVLANPIPRKLFNSPIPAEDSVSDNLICKPEDKLDVTVYGVPISTFNLNIHSSSFNGAPKSNVEVVFVPFLFIIKANFSLTTSTWLSGVSWETHAKSATAWLSYELKFSLISGNLLSAYWLKSSVKSTILKNTLVTI